MAGMSLIICVHVIILVLGRNHLIILNLYVILRFISCESLLWRKINKYDSRLQDPGRHSVSLYHRIFCWYFLLDFYNFLFEFRSVWDLLQPNMSFLKLNFKKYALWFKHFVYYMTHNEWVICYEPYNILICYELHDEVITYKAQFFDEWVLLNKHHTVLLVKCDR